MLPMLLWLDVETTGLDYKFDRLLEVGAVVTDESLRPIDQASRVFHLDPDGKGVLSKVILDMHGSNGLLEEALDSPYDPHNEQHWDFLNRLLTKYWGQKSKAVLAGWNVASFDRLWVEYHAPQPMFRMVNYRHMDLTAIRFCTPAGRQPDKLQFEPHRALFDCYAGIAWLRHVLSRCPGMVGSDPYPPVVA